LVGDWDGDGDDTIGLYRRSTGTFYLKNSNTAGPADVVVAFGPANAGWLPLAGNWDGDADDTFGLYSPMSSTFFLRNQLTGGAADFTFQFGPGNSGWTPLAGDWNSDGADTVGFFTPGTSRFLLRNQHTGGAADVNFGFGPTGQNWLPIVGDWDGSFSSSGLVALAGPSSPATEEESRAAAHDSLLYDREELDEILSTAFVDNSDDSAEISDQLAGSDDPPRLEALDMALSEWPA
jgi:hypothetical protein